MSLISKDTGYNNEIPSVKNKPENPCPICKGKGRYKSGHSFIHGNIYNKCFTCNGTGDADKTIYKTDNQNKNNNV